MDVAGADGAIGTAKVNCELGAVEVAGAGGGGMEGLGDNRSFCGEPFGNGVVSRLDERGVLVPQTRS